MKEHSMVTLLELTDRIIATGDRRVTRRVKRWKTREGSFEAFYFLGEVYRGKPVEVYAMVGVPAGRGPFPGVLHYHGGGQTVKQEHVETLVRHGYACLSFDYTGPRDKRPFVTSWGKVTKEIYGNFFPKCPERSSLAHAVAMARQALSLLAAQPRVDTGRLGVFGISWGGYQTWLLNGIERRLKAAVAIYGCGLNRLNGYALPKPFPAGARRVWRRLFDPLAYVRVQHGAVLFLNGTNDFFGWMPRAETLARQLDARHRAAFAAHQNHCMAELTPTMMAWFDTHLKGRGTFPERPDAACAIRNGNLRLTSRALRKASRALFYVAAKGPVPPAWFWRPVPAQRRGGLFNATAPMAVIGTSRFAYYVHQYLENGLQMSSFPHSGASRQSVARHEMPAGSAWFGLDPELWYMSVGTEPFKRPGVLRTGKMHGRRGLVVPAETMIANCFNLNTRIPADRSYRPPFGARFVCVLEGPVVGPVVIAVLRNAGTPRERRYKGSFSIAELAAGVPLSVLRDAGGKRVQGGTSLSHLSIGAKTSRKADVIMTKAGWQMERSPLRPSESNTG